jgi:hypothetical protein
MEGQPVAVEDMIKSRGRAFEEEHIRKHEAQLLERLRQRAHLDKLAEALAVELQVSQPDLLKRIMDFGITLETGAAFLLSPLVQIAWAEGKVTDAEREAVFQIAAECGIDKGTPAYAKLDEWLGERPSDALFDTTIEAIKAGLTVLTPEERAERVTRIVGFCRRVASASGGGLARVLGLSSGVSQDEESLIDAIGNTLRAR